MWRASDLSVSLYDSVYVYIQRVVQPRSGKARQASGLRPHTYSVKNNNSKATIARADHQRLENDNDGSSTALKRKRPQQTTNAPPDRS